MNSQNVNISIPSDQLEAVQAYLQTLQIGDPPATTVAETPNEQVYDPTFFCGQEYEVKDVIDHKNDGPSWEFLIRWSNGTESWIADDECNCEVFISEYLHRLGINTVYIFCRVSTKNQSRTDCVSLDAQLDELLPLAHQILAHQIGCQRIKVIKISKGAYKKVPKEMLDICEAAQAGDHVLIYRVDRLSRNIFDFLKEIEELRYRGVTVYSHQDHLTYNNISERTEFAQKILDAQKESELIGKRVKTSIEFRKRRGDHVGSVPYGKIHARDSNGKMVVVDNLDEIDLIKKIKNMQGWPQDVANYLNSEGVKKRGLFWSENMVTSLRNKFDRDGKRI